MPTRSSISASPAIVWFRDDLRLSDNPALAAAAAGGRPVLCLYVHDEDASLRPLGGAARWWLHGALAALAAAVAERGGSLEILSGPAASSILAAAQSVGAGAVYWNRRYDAAGRATDSRLKTALKARGIAAQSFNAGLLREPWEVATKSGASYSVFTAYWRAACAMGAPPKPHPAPARIVFASLPTNWRAVSLDTLALEPRAPDWARGFRALWRPGEAAAQARLEAFLGNGLADYAAQRDRPDRAATSRLSPYLRFGNISPRQIWHAVAAARAADARLERSAEKFLAEVGWREFCHHLLYHRPDLGERNLRPEFDRMPWSADDKALRAWQKGRTGYPIVDAGLRELWTTGWMHNRVRMIAASFLTKHLLVDWRRGEAWFWDTLVDADAASNAAGWQWVAGSGADAAPFFRIFNPVLQGEKFDPDGAYVRRWIPELVHLPPSQVHRPWHAAQKASRYPRPIVEHATARARALAAWRSLRAD